MGQMAGQWTGQRAEEEEEEEDVVSRSNAKLSGTSASHGPSIVLCRLWAPWLTLCLLC